MHHWSSKKLGLYVRQHGRIQRGMAGVPDPLSEESPK